MSDQELIIPDRITERLKVITREVDDLISKAEDIQKTKLKLLQFRFHQRASKPTLSNFERAQSVCFVTRYEGLPILEGVGVLHKDDGSYTFDNLNFMRHVLNEFRPILGNQKDSVYYHNVNNFIMKKLINNSPEVDLDISVYDEHENNVTDSFIKILDERIKSIRVILEECEFKYIYNGILQHSDHEYTNRFWNDYNTGEINYIFLKHALVLGPIKQMLYWHYKVTNILTFPTPGGL